jgi:uncharacterized protein (TIGR04255 family)
MVVYIIKLLLLIFAQHMLAEYSNRHLVEVNCGFQFPQETIAWDNIFFGQYYERIKIKGFTERETRKGVQIKFQGTPGSNSTIPFTSSEIEDQVIFKNSDKGWAISIGKGKISFHIIKGYQKWEVFLSEFIEPYFKLYTELGLGNGMRQCNIVYLNRFLKPINEKLADYFTIISQLDAKFGVETTTSLQRVIRNDSNLLITKLNTQLLPNGLNINLECGAICTSVVCMNSQDWIFQANSTHAPIKDFFESLITEKLRKEL